jgi:hypothetical protein
MSEPRPAPIRRLDVQRTCSQCHESIDELPAGARRCIRCEGFTQLAETLPRLHLAIEGWLGLPSRIRERLAAEGVRGIDGWRVLGERRRMIFGVTPEWVKRIDQLAQGAP